MSAGGVDDTVAVDSNVWIYTFDAELSEHADVKPAMTELLSSDTALFVNTVIRLEVVHYLVKNLEKDADADPTKFLNLDGVVSVPVTAEDVTRATEILTEHDDTGVGGRDASLVATMDRNDVSTLWTHDSGLKRLGDRLDRLEVHDPCVP